LGNENFVNQHSCLLIATLSTYGQMPFPNQLCFLYFTAYRASSVHITNLKLKVVLEWTSHQA